MEAFDFRQWSRRAADWAADYRSTLRGRPVRARTTPGAVMAQTAQAPPQAADEMATIFADFERIVPGGMTHWQHPRFFAYFPSNASPAAVVAEQLATAMSAQCMLWQTSPAATELEVRMVDWIRQAVGLPETFEGVLQDTASSATLCAMLVMRERALAWKGNREGLSGQLRLRVYASQAAHSSIDKAAWVTGVGQDNLVKIPTDAHLAMDLGALRDAIRRDRDAGLTPAGIVICVGGTSVGAVDAVRAVAEIAREEDLYTHVDAAWAGSAMICPELRALWDGVELTDSVVINPHKWLGAPLECSAHFVRDSAALVRTLAIRPEYLKTYGRDGVVNLSEWSVPLGRRFRALKVWFLFRAYGLNGLQTRIRNHIAWAERLAVRLGAEPDFEITSTPVLSLFSFRYVPAAVPSDPDALNLRLLNRINDDGTIYLTQTRHAGRLVIRFVVGQFETQAEDVDLAFEVITRTARSLEDHP